MALKITSQLEWHVLAIPALREQRQEDHCKLQASIVYKDLVSKIKFKKKNIFEVGDMSWEDDSAGKII